MTLTERPSIPGSRFAERLERAVAATDTAGLAATLVSVGSDLRYLTGYAALPLERLTLLVLRPGSRPAIIVPRTHPRREQHIRAESAERLGLVRMLLPERDGDDAAVMAEAIKALPGQRRPSERRIPGLMDGLRTIAGLARAPMPPFAAAGE